MPAPRSPSTACPACTNSAPQLLRVEGQKAALRLKREFRERTSFGLGPERPGCIAYQQTGVLTALSPDCYFRGSLYSGAG
jgi:hypothetical protein